MPVTWLTHLAQTLGIKNKTIEKTARKTNALPGSPVIIVV